MATNESFGGLGGLSSSERSGLNTEALSLDTNQGIMGNLSGKGIGAAISNAVPTAISTGLSFAGLAKGLGNIQNDRAAQKGMNKSYGPVNVAQSLLSMGRPTQTLANLMDTDKSGRVGRDELSNAYGIDITNSGYGAGVERGNPSSLSGIGMDFGITDVDQFGFSTNPNTYSSREAANIGLDTQTGIGRGVDTVGLGGLGKAGYKGSVGNMFGFGKAEGVNTDDPNSTGASTGIGGSAAGVAGMGDESGAGTGSSSSSATAGQDTATSGPTGTSYSSDEQGSGGGSSGSTYICTALYEMGDMKKSIYKYDQIYGKQVDPATYRGYELWGKYVATKLRKKGIVYKVAKPIALTWANQMAYDLSKGKVGKNSTLIKITKTIGEGACYVLGQIFKRRKLWLISQ